MKYYKISQSSITSNIVKIPYIDESELKDVYGLVKEIKKGEGSGLLLNFYENPFPIVSDELKKVVYAFDGSCISHPLALANMDKKGLVLYWILRLTQIKCKSQESIVINRDDIGSKKIFKVKLGVRNYVIIDFDIAEEILRKEIVDIDLKEVEING